VKRAGTIVALLMLLGAASAQGQVSMESISPMQAARFVFTPAQVLTFGPSGPLVIQGVPGHIIRVYDGMFQKEAGGAYTFGHFGHFIQPQMDTPSRTPVLSLAIDGVLNRTDEGISYQGPGGLQLPPRAAPFESFAGAGIRMGVNGGVNSYGGPGANIHLTIIYRVIPVRLAEVMAAIPEVPLP
jgi:hypothetical protein